MTAFDPTVLRPDAPAMPCEPDQTSLTAWQKELARWQKDAGLPAGPPPHRTGLTARQHAAIALRVPDSGTPWLDEMIRTSLRDDAAFAAMKAYLESRRIEASQAEFAEGSYVMADAMLAARETK